MNHFEDKPFPYEHSSGHGTVMAYSVQARSPNEPEVVGKQVFGSAWRAVEFYASPIGIPRDPHIDDAAGHYSGLTSYEGAQALRWWFHAELHQHHIFSGVETRLVQHKITYDRKVEAIEAIENVTDAVMDVIRGGPLPPKPEVTK